jgi:predicted RNA binding protein YcfA (HicA-like mRNA interferase family)
MIRNHDDLVLYGGRAVKVREVIRRLERDGWVLTRTRGSHRQFKHPSKRWVVTVSGHASVDVPTGTLKNIWRQAEIEDEK